MTAPVPASTPLTSARPHRLFPDPAKRTRDQARAAWRELATWVRTVETRAWSSAASTSGLEVLDARALVELQGGRSAVGALGHRLGITSGGATKLGRRLCDLGLVRREHLEDDARSVLLALTEAGEDAARKVLDVYHAHTESSSRQLASFPGAVR